MAKDKSTFFTTKEEHPWSRTKDSLLGCYLKPFFDKTYGYSPDGYVYVDAFAGPGEYDDGSVGSPIIAIQRLLSSSRSSRRKCNTQFIFAEARAKDRERLTAVANRARGNVNHVLPPLICNSFEEAITVAQSARPRRGKKPSTVFYYVDPYGVKDLRLDLLCQSPNPGYTEVLVNFNTVGFMRDGAEALRLAFELPAGVKVLDQGFDGDVPMTERIERLNACIGSDGWQSILQRNDIDYWERERLIGQLFCDSAKKHYKYVTNMPIKNMAHMRDKNGEVKYRLIHMTNSADGCILMNDNMLKRNEDDQVIQAQLFMVDIDSHEIDSEAIANDVAIAIERMPRGRSVSMGSFAAAIINGYGVFDKASSLLKTYLGPYLDSGILVRDDYYTPKTHKPSKSFGYKKKVHKP